MADNWDSFPDASPMDIALDAEGASPSDAAVARSIYQQESGSGKNTKTSNADAHGGMQIIPATFNSVADKGWDINNPVDNARAGVRYIQQLSQKAGGDPALTAAGYYGGPGAIDKAQKGVAVSDPRNPNAPNTLQYGQQVAGRIEKGNWWDNYPDANAPSDPSVAPQQAPQNPGNGQVATGSVQPANPDPNGYGAPPPSDNTQFALPGQISPAQQAAQQAAQQPQKGWFQRAADEFTDSPLGAVGNVAHGVVDGLSFGLVDKAGVALNAAANFQDGGTFSDRYHNVLEGVHKYEDQSPAFLAGQIGSAFVPGAGDISLVNKAVQAVPTASRTARVVAGGAAGMTEGAAQVLGHADNLDDVTPGQMAMGMGLGALGGGVGGAFTKATDNQLANTFLNKAGSIENGQRDAQIISDLQAMSSRSAQGGSKLGPADANALARRYTQDAADQLRQMPKTQDRQDLLNALQRARGLDDSQIAALRKLPNGDAVADAIQMNQRTLALTAPTPANLGKMASAARMLVDNGALHAISNTVPGGSLLTLAPVRHYVMGALLGGRENRTANIASALDQGSAAQAFLSRFGQGSANQSAQSLAQAAQAAQAARAAAAATQGGARATQQGNNAFQRAQAAAQAARAQAAAANPMTAANQATGRQAMANAIQAGQANRANIAQQTQQAGQAAASVGPQMNAAQAKAAQAQVAQQAQQAAASIGPQIAPEQRAAYQAQQAAQAAKAQEALKVQAAQKQALADQVASDPTHLLGMSNPFGPPRNEAQMKEFANVMRAQAQAAAPRGPQVPAQGLEAAQAAATAATAKKAAKQVASQNLSDTVERIAGGNFNGLTFESPAAKMMLAHLGNSDPEVVKAGIAKLAAESPDTHGKVAAMMLSSSGQKFRYYGLQDALRAMPEIGSRTPSEVEKAAIMGRSLPAEAPAAQAPALEGIQHPKAWTSAKESRQIIQKNALETAKDPEVKKLVAKLIDTKNVKGAENPNVNRQKAFDAFMKGANTDQQIEAKRIAEPLVSYGK